MGGAAAADADDAPNGFERGRLMQQDDALAVAATEHHAGPLPGGDSNHGSGRQQRASTGVDHGLLADGLGRIVNAAGGSGAPTLIQQLVRKLLGKGAGKGAASQYINVK